MFGLFSSSKKEKSDGRDVNNDVGRLFFDSFSKRVGSVEESMQTVSAEIVKLKTFMERGQVSDLVLLERLRRTETLVRESLVSIKESIERMCAVGLTSAAVSVATDENSTAEPEAQNSPVTLPVIPARVLSPVGEVGTLQSITTPTELQVLTLLANEGPKSAPEIGKAVGRSREHTARLMKKLYEEGYIRRDQVRIPFRYSLVEKVKQGFKKTEVKNEAKEQISVPQT